MTTPPDNAPQNQPAATRIVAGQTSAPKRPLGLKIGIVDGILALGYSFRDADGRQLYGSGRALGQIHTIHRTSLPELADTELIVASDVHNPLLGPNGASAVSGPQKGAGPDDVAALDKGLQHLVAKLNEAAVTIPSSSRSSRKR